MKNIPKKSVTQLSQLKIADVQLKDVTTDNIKDFVDTDNIDNNIDNMDI